MVCVAVFELVYAEERQSNGRQRILIDSSALRVAGPNSCGRFPIERAMKSCNELHRTCSRSL